MSLYAILYSVTKQESKIFRISLLELNHTQLDQVIPIPIYS